ncbi:MAG: energy transducer TonB [Pseudomonadota bacterium]
MASSALSPQQDLNEPIWPGATERTSLGVAVLLHAALVGLFFLGWERQNQVAREARMTVSLASDVSLENMGPQIIEESRAAIAPELSDTPEAVANDQTPVPDPPSPSSQPAPRAQEAPRIARPPRRPPAPNRDRSRPDRAPQSSQRPATSANERARGSRVGEDFLSGQGDSTSTDETRAPAATFGRAERAALSSAITRQLRPHWNAPTGVDAEKLVSTVSWKLNPDGSLKGRPTCQTLSSSVTASNRPQAGLHCERAIRAVQLAAPFNLPEQFYNRWDDLEWQFDRRL